MGFLDLSDRYARLDAKNDPLVEINRIVPREEFRPLLEQGWLTPTARRNPVPDAKTVWLYREEMTQAGKVADLFKLIRRHHVSAAAMQRSSG